jgi:hypothetical protein
VFPEQVGERLIRQLLEGCHPVASQLFQFVEGIVVEGDQFAHAFSGSCAIGFNNIQAGRTKMVPLGGGGGHEAAARKRRDFGQPDDI